MQVKRCLQKMFARVALLKTGVLFKTGCAVACYHGVDILYGIYVHNGTHCCLHHKLRIEHRWFLRSIPTLQRADCWLPSYGDCTKVWSLKWAPGFVCGRIIWCLGFFEAHISLPKMPRKPLQTNGSVGKSQDCHW